MESPFNNDDSPFGFIDELSGPLTYSPGTPSAEIEPETTHNLQIEINDGNIHIKVGATKLPVTIHFSDDTKIVHGSGSSVIVVTRGTRYSVTRRQTNLKS
jgi:hypothetical protein